MARSNNGSSVGAGHFGAGAGLLVLTFLGWIVALAGVSALRKQTTGTPDGQVAYGSLDWWVIWLEFAVLLIAAGLHFMSFRASSVGVVGLLAVVTTLTMYMTNEYYFRYGAVSNNKRLNTAFAGFIILSICNSLLILVIGTHPEQIENTTYTHKAPAGAATTAPATTAPGNAGAARTIL